MLHCKFIIQFVGEKLLKIGEHLASIQAKWLIVSYVPFALDFCPQRCTTRQISKLTVTKCCYVNSQTAVNLLGLSTNIELLWTSFDVLTDRLMPPVTDRMLIMYTAFWCSILFFVTGFFYMAGVNIILLVNETMNILPHKYFKTVFEWLSLTWQFVSITSWALRFFEHTPWVKKQDTKLLAITSQTIIRFSNFFFTSQLGSKFATNSCLNIPPRFKHVATLPCEIWMQKNGIILKYVLQLMMNHKVV